METFRISGDDNRLYFKNTKRIPDKEEYERVMSHLKKAGCEIGDKIMGPDCDIIHCKYQGNAFGVVRTIDGDGTFLYSDDALAIKILEEVFQ